MIACVVTVPAVAMMIADCGLGTTLVVIGNVALDEPADTVTLAGTEAAVGLSLDSATTNPPDGAAAVRRTVPVEELPPRTSAGLMLTDESAAAVPGAGVGVGDGLLTVQPERVAVAGVGEPSLTATLQSAGFANGSRSARKLPAPSLVVTWVPSTVIGELGAAVPSTRSRVPLSSARETRTVADAAGAATPARTTTSRPSSVKRCELRVAERDR